MKKGYERSRHMATQAELFQSSIDAQRELHNIRRHQQLHRPAFLSNTQSTSQKSHNTSSTSQSNNFDDDDFVFEAEVISAPTPLTQPKMAPRRGISRYAMKTDNSDDDDDNTPINLDELSVQDIQEEKPYIQIIESIKPETSSRPTRAQLLAQALDAQKQNDFNTNENLDDIAKKITQGNNTTSIDASINNNISNVNLNSNSTTNQDDSSNMINQPNKSDSSSTIINSNNTAQTLKRPIDDIAATTLVDKFDFLQYKSKSNRDYAFILTDVEKEELASKEQLRIENEKMARQGQVHLNVIASLQHEAAVLKRQKEEEANNSDNLPEDVDNEDDEEVDIHRWKLREVDRVLRELHVIKLQEQEEVLQEWLQHLTPAKRDIELKSIAKIRQKMILNSTLQDPVAQKMAEKIKQDINRRSKKGRINDDYSEKKRRFEQSGDVDDNKGEDNLPRKRQKADITALYSTLKPRHGRQYNNYNKSRR